MLFFLTIIQLSYVKFLQSKFSSAVKMKLYHLILMNSCITVAYVSYVHRRDKTEWLGENIKRLISFK